MCNKKGNHKKMSKQYTGIIMRNYDNTWEYVSSYKEHPAQRLSSETNPEFPISEDGSYLVGAVYVLKATSHKRLAIRLGISLEEAKKLVFYQDDFSLEAFV